MKPLYIVLITSHLNITYIKKRPVSIIPWDGLINELCYEFSVSKRPIQRMKPKKTLLIQCTKVIYG